MSKLGSKPESWSGVSQFFANRSVFVTGGSGFLGKVLIEKLLHDCPDIKRIYILVRTKGTAQAQSRLAQLFQSRAFDRIKRIQPSLLEKVHVIRGDITFDNLAISASDLTIIKNEVSVIIHSAATIRFDEPLSRATRLNVTATKMMLDLALQLDHLKAFIHVSTAYCNQTKIDIKEIVYEEVLTPEKLIELSNDLTEDMLESLSPHLFGDRASSYHYTKAMAEQLIRSYSDRLPVGIVRPSIIAASLKEPMPGWVDNYNGISGYIAASGSGILRALLADSSFICDAIPVDIVANTIIATAWHVANEGDKNTAKKDTLTAGKTGQPLIINCTSGSINPITWGEIKTLLHPSLVKYPPLQVFRYPGPVFVSNKILLKVLVAIDHDLPRFVIDFVFKLLGVPPILGPVYQKVNRTTKALEYFTYNEWLYRNENFQALNETLNPEDRRRFLIDVRDIDWASYLENHVLGVRHYVLEEDPKTLDAAQLKMTMIYYATQAAKVSAVGVTAFGLYRLLMMRKLRN